jgi:ATP-binding cassette subfamily B protein
VLGKGEIEAIGTHKELIKQEGLYKRLWDIQGNLEEDFLKTIEGDING